MRGATVGLSLDIFCRGFLRELGEEYLVEAVAAPGPLLDRIREREGITVHEVEMSRSISLIGDLLAIARMTRLFRQRKPDMVHSITPKAGMVMMVAAWLAGVPLRVHTFTGLLFPTAKGVMRLALKSVDRLIASCATHIIAEGEGVRHDLMEVTGKEITVLGHGNVRGIDLEYFKPHGEPAVLTKTQKQQRNNYHHGDSEEYGTQTIGNNIKQFSPCLRGEYRFLYVGRMNRDKGIRELAEAFAELAKDHKDIRLTMVGAGIEGEKDLDAATIEVIRHHPQIEVHPWVDDVRPYYEASDCLVLPSYREGFPNSVLEAGAMELPCIVTDINGSREIISEGVNGAIVPPRDTSALKSAMAKAIANPEQWAQMGRIARQIIAERYEIHYVRNCQKEYYADLFGKSKASQPQVVGLD